MSEYQKVFNLLRQAGMTEAGAIGMIGNWECESNCEPLRVQGDFSPYRNASKAYVSNLYSGSVSRSSFMNDQKGFGLAQWTYFTRKGDMYDYWKQTGIPIESAEFQVAFAIKELKRDFIPDWRLVCSTKDIYEAVKNICARFENPAVHNIDARFQAAQMIKGQLDLNQWQNVHYDPVPSGGGSSDSSGSGSGSDFPQIPATEFWPPRIVDKNMTGDDVLALQAILKARAFYVIGPVDGHFTAELETAVKQFQETYSLGTDGVVGLLTWRKLLEM